MPVWFGPVADERVGVYAGMIIQLFRDPAFAAWLFAAEGGPGADADAYAGLIARVAAEEALDAGIARLPLTDEAAYLATATAFATWVAGNVPDACRHIITTDDPNDERSRALQAEYQNTLPREALAAYLDVGYRAILAEINDVPAAVTFTETELGRANETYRAAIEAAVLARPNAEALVAAANDRADATDADFCEVMLLTLTLVDVLPQPERDWTVHLIVTQQ